MTAKEFLAKYSLVMDVVGVPENPHMDDKGKDMFNWHCTMYVLAADYHGEYKGKTFTTYFGKGKAHVGFLMDVKRKEGEETVRGKEWVRATEMQIRQGTWGERQYPTPQPIPAELGEVLECLAMDFQGVENARTFENWASEYGYDTDSRKAEKTYEYIREQSVAFTGAFGFAAYADLLTVQEACSKCGKECNNCQC